MKTQFKHVSAFLVLFTIAVVPSASRAEDDNVNDGKSYPGSMCFPILSSVGSTRPGSQYINTSGSAANVVCPIVQDSWESTAGLAYSGMTIYNPPGGTFSCGETAYDNAGNAISTRSFSTTASGVSFNYFNNGTYLPTTGAEGTIAITCTVPNNGQIKGYLVQEYA